MQYISLILIAFFSLDLSAIDLPTLSTKQAVENIRFISKDGKYTYYYSQSGALQLSTNYDFKVLHKAEKNTQYLVSSSELEKNIIFEKISHPHSKVNLKMNHTIYLGPIGENKFKEIARGKNPKLQLDDKYLTYFDQTKMEIYLLNLLTNTTKTIKLFNKVNPYYQPTVIMLTQTDIMYTDINSSGHEALIYYSFIGNSRNPIYKSRFRGSKVEFCIQNEKIIVAEFPQTNLKSTSQIILFDLYTSKNFTVQENIYSSQLPDLGQMICQKNKLTFLKTYDVDEKINYKQTDVAQIDLSTKSLTRITKQSNFNQLLLFSNSIISPKNGKFFIVDGSVKIQDDSITKDKND